MAVVVSRNSLERASRRVDFNPYMGVLQPQELMIDNGFLINHFNLMTDAGMALGGSREPKTGFVTESDSLRNGLTIAFTTCVREKRKWASISIDLDQLKRANEDVSHLFGDIFIQWGANRVIDILKSNRLGEALLGKTVLYKSSNTSDETKIFFFDITGEEMDEIKRIAASIDDTKREIPAEDIKAKDPFTFSLSSGLVTSDDDQIKIAASLSRDHTELEVFWDLFNYVNDTCDTLTTGKKLQKDIGRFNIRLAQVKEQNDINHFNQWIIEEYGDGRVKRQIFFMILRLAEIFTLIHLSNIVPEDSDLLLRHLGITIDELRDIRSIQTLQKLFSKIYKTTIDDSYSRLFTTLSF